MTERYSIPLSILKDGEVNSSKVVKYRLIGIEITYCSRAET